MSYSLVGTPAQPTWSAPKNSTSFTVSITNVTVGDVVCLSLFPDTVYGLPAGITLSGGGVTTWHVVDSGATGIQYIAWGVVTTTGANTLTVTHTANVSSALSGVAAQAEFSSSLGSAWVQDAALLYATTTTTSVWTSSSLTPSADALMLVLMDAGTIGGGLNMPTVPSPSATTEATGASSVNNIGYFYLLGSGTAPLTVEVSDSGNTMGAGGVVIFFLEVLPPSSPPPIRVYSQAVQRASAWMKRETGLWSPESGLIPRAA